MFLHRVLEFTAGGIFLIAIPLWAEQLIKIGKSRFVHPDTGQGALFIIHILALPLLEQFGFACEDFGAGALLVREVPADIDAADTVPTLEEFAERLRTGRSPDEKREALLHTMACKAAIKGGWVSDPAELRVLVDRVQSGEIKYCPHGRPVAVKLTKYELEKMFKRA